MDVMERLHYLQPLYLYYNFNLELAKLFFKFLVRTVVISLVFIRKNINSNLIRDIWKKINTKTNETLLSKKNLSLKSVPIHMKQMLYICWHYLGDIFLFLMIVSRNLLYCVRQGTWNRLHSTKIMRCLKIILTIL